MQRLVSSAGFAVVCALGASVVMSAPAAAQYGPDTCRQGFVWRDSYPGDHVCVPVETRERAARDNVRAPYRFAY